MMHFFGVLSPNGGNTYGSEEAPFKSSLFGKIADNAIVTRGGEDATDKGAEPDNTEDDEHLRFVRLCLPPNW